MVFSTLSTCALKSPKGLLFQILLMDCGLRKISILRTSGCAHEDKIRMFIIFLYSTAYITIYFLNNKQVLYYPYVILV